MRCAATLTFLCLSLSLYIFKFIQYEISTDLKIVSTLDWPVCASVCVRCGDVIVIIPNLILYSNSLLIPLDNYYRRVFLFLFLQIVKRIVPVCVCVRCARCVCVCASGKEREQRKIYSGSSLFVPLKL